MQSHTHPGEHTHVHTLTYARALREAHIHTLMHTHMHRLMYAHTQAHS